MSKEDSTVVLLKKPVQITISWKTEYGNVQLDLEPPEHFETWFFHVTKENLALLENHKLLVED